jgi:hypothetical protein
MEDEISGEAQCFNNRYPVLHFVLQSVRIDYSWKSTLSSPNHSSLTKPPMKTLLNSEQIAQIAIIYLNKNSLKSEIAVDCIQKSELVHHHFINLKSKLTIEYTFQHGRLDDEAYRRAQDNYEIQYQQYQTAKTLWIAADEAARRAESPGFGGLKRGTSAPEPRSPTEPSQTDYIRWGDYLSETTAHEGTLLKPVQPELLPGINKKLFDSYAEVNFFVPTALAEASGFVLKKVDPQLIKNVAHQIHDAAAKVAVDKALEDYHHRNMTYCITQDESTYADMVLSIWDVTFEDDKKLKKIHIDEINNVIDGEKIDESKMWGAIFAKHAALLVVLCSAMMQFMGGFVSFLGALVLQWGAFCGLYLYHKTSAKPSADLAKLLDFFYIRELANQPNTKTQHLLDNYLVGLDAYDALMASQKERRKLLLEHQIKLTFVPLPQS